MHARKGTVQCAIGKEQEVCIQRRNRINILELLSIKLALLTFRKMMKLESVHAQLDSLAALSYLSKMVETKSHKRMAISNKI